MVGSFPHHEGSRAGSELLGHAAERRGLLRRTLDRPNSDSAHFNLLSTSRRGSIGSVRTCSELARRDSIGTPAKSARGQILPHQRRSGGATSVRSDDATLSNAPMSRAIPRRWLGLPGICAMGPIQVRRRRSVHRDPRMSGNVLHTRNRRGWTWRCPPSTLSVIDYHLFGPIAAGSPHDKQDCST